MKKTITLGLTLALVAGASLLSLAQPAQAQVYSPTYGYSAVTPYTNTGYGYGNTGLMSGLMGGGGCHHHHHHNWMNQMSQMNGMNSMYGNSTYGYPATMNTAYNPYLYNNVSSVSPYTYGTLPVSNAYGYGATPYGYGTSAYGYPSTSLMGRILNRF